MKEAELECSMATAQVLVDFVCFFYHKGDELIRLSYQKLIFNELKWFFYTL